VTDRSTKKLTPGVGSGPRFLFVYGPAGMTRHVLAVGRLVLGRSDACDIVIEHETVSRQHAALEVDKDGIFVEDLGSANGTSIGGVPIAKKTALAPGAMFALGDVVAVVRSVEGARAGATAEAGVQATDRVIELVAPTPLPVLILGETGVGKEVLAERIVRQSNRRNGPFVRVNCAALTETLFESELFGHERGAFTSADRAKQGLLEAADGGTLLLDEVGELLPAAQAKLLRVLESGEVTRVGAVTPKRVDVRIIAATNRDLAAMVEEGFFRADLLFRLDGVTIRLPPLRERSAEIPTLARTLLEAACATAGRSTPALSDGAMRVLASHDWPGNVRELRRVMERVAALVPGDVARAEDLEPLLTVAAQKRDRTPSTLPQEIKSEVASIERARIEEALRRAAGNQTQAAKLLGISRRTLIDRIERFGLPRPRKT
jgi:two-component system response regulator AtoC